MARSGEPGAMSDSREHITIEPLLAPANGEERRTSDMPEGWAPARSRSAPQRRAHHGQPTGIASADDEPGMYHEYDDEDTDRWASEDEARRVSADYRRSEYAQARARADGEIPESRSAGSPQVDQGNGGASSTLGGSDSRRGDSRRGGPSRRPNPWEHSNRKTFKPIITIGKPNDFAGRSIMHRRRTPGMTGRGAPAVPTTSTLASTTAESLLRSAFRCSSLCIGAAIDVKEVYQHYQMRGLHCTAYKDGLNVVVHCLHHSEDDESDAHAFYFTYGGMVLWNLDPTVEQALVQEACDLFSRGTLDEPEVDDFLYVYEAQKPDAKPHIHKDVIHLTTSDIMEKLAVAFGLAQSAKLGVFERITEATISNTRSIPEQLAQSGKISLSRKEISMRVGQLFVDRSSVNLHSDMLDTPDFFWEDDEWEPLYQKTAKYLEIEKRVNVLNHRLDIIKDLFDMLASEMHAKHATNLEVIVIVLILIEVIFQVLELMQNRVFADS